MFLKTEAGSPAGFEVNTRIDAVEYGIPGDPDGTETWLCYFADEETRSEWDGPVPPKEPLPYDRDRFLPGAP